MTIEEKVLLLKDLCARLPYGVIINIQNDYSKDRTQDMKLNVNHLNSTYSIEYKHLRPYLRPMSSMMEEERVEYFGNRMTPWAQNEFGESNTEAVMQYRIDFLLEHHFDHRGLIEKGLALEALEGMYKIE